MNQVPVSKLIFVALTAAIAAGSAFAQTNSPDLARASKTIALPPEPPVAKAAVDFFRELLLMTPVDRDNALKERPPENKTAILNKVREYESLNADERELRLRAT